MVSYFHIQPKKEVSSLIQHAFLFSPLSACVGCAWTSFCIGRLIWAAVDSLWTSVLLSSILHSGQMWRGIIQTSAKQDWQREPWMVTSLINSSKMWSPSKWFPHSLQVRVTMTVTVQSPRRLSRWSYNQFQHHRWCCNQNCGTCWILIIFADKCLGTKNQRGPIRGHWKMPLLMTAFPSLSRDTIMVLGFPLPSCPSSASLSFESLTRQRGGNRKKRTGHLNPPSNSHCSALSRENCEQMWTPVSQGGRDLRQDGSSCLVLALEQPAQPVTEISRGVRT